MSNWRFGIVVVVLNGKPPLMGEVLCSTENSPFLIIDHIHAKINRVCCAALAIGKRCMNVRKNKLLLYILRIIILYRYYSNRVCIFAMSPCIAAILEEKSSIFPVLRIL